MWPPVNTTRSSRSTSTDRLGHVVEHERQRGDRQPGFALRQEGGASERPRQPRPELQRRHPDHDPRLRAACRGRVPSSGAEAISSDLTSALLSLIRFSYSFFSFLYLLFFFFLFFLY